MKRIIFESAPEFVVLCLLVALAYASIQYLRTRKQPWNAKMNWLLFSFRAVLVFLVAFMLLGPIVKQITNHYERPTFIVLQDNSTSISQAVEPKTLNALQESIAETQNLLQEKGYDVSRWNLNQNSSGNDSILYNANSSDLNTALKRVANRFEGQNIAGVILVSDGIYNAGVSPLYTPFNFPIHTIAIGDTSERSDIAIKNIAYNKITYQGNKFPLRPEIQVNNMQPQPVIVSLYKSGKLIDRQTKNSTGDQLIAFDFQPLADEQGIQKYDIEVEVNPSEYNKKNNRASVFVEVVEGRKKILVVGASPHPDIKALREVVEKNSNYEFLLHIPGVSEQQASELRPEQIDLAIFHQAPDLRGKTTNLFQAFAASKTSLLLISGRQSDLQQIARQKMPVRYERSPRDYDEVTPVSNPAFSNFSLSAEANSIIAGYPPVSVHYGKVQLPASTTTLLFQRVGNVSTDKALLAVDVNDGRKIGVLMGEGIWRWRLNEFDRNENTVGFDELFGKLIQFLSTTEDKRKFRSYPIQQEFSDTEPVVFESQVYNDIFEPVFGNTITIEITSESGEKREYTYVTSPGNIRYQIGGLKEGVYRYRARTTINNRVEEVRGEFAVIERQIEQQNLTADFDMLRKLSASTGGRFVKADETENLANYFQQTQAQSIIHSEETYDSVINLKWVFFLLLILLSAEWTLRKYHGSY